VRQRNRHGVVEGKQGVDSRDKVKHIKRNDQLSVTRMMLVVERE